MEINFEWFKKELLPTLQGYKLECRFFKEGDFGDLERVELDGHSKAATIDFWSSGWLGIDIFDYKKDGMVFNIFLEPQQIVEKGKAFEEFRRLLQDDNVRN